MLLGLAFSSLLGFCAGVCLMLAIYWLFRNAGRTAAKRSFRWLQIGSSAFMAFSHGLNDGQKFIGTFALALMLGGILPGFRIPIWVILLCASVMALGTSIGGWKLIKTLGSKVVRLKVHHGFVAESAAAGTITLASAFGIPLSTTHTISTAIVGVGAAARLNAVRWTVVRDMITAWLLTFPICGAIAWSAAKLSVMVGGILAGLPHEVSDR